MRVFKIGPLAWRREKMLRLDWTKNDSDLAGSAGICPEGVRYWRLKFGKPRHPRGNPHRK